MCGIAGIVGEISEPNRTALRSMAAAMDHRGPDAGGFWESPADAEGRGCLLGFRRLSILDLSTAADQPMTDPVRRADDRLQRRDLQLRGAARRAAGRGAHLHQLGRHRRHAPPARAAWRGRLRTPARHVRVRALGSTPAAALLGARPARDQAALRVPEPGSATASWSLLFASEVRSIIASGLLGRPRLDPGAVASVIWNGFVMAPGTAVLGVASVLPGDLQVHDRRGRLLDVVHVLVTTGRGVGPARSAGDELGRRPQRVRASPSGFSDVPLGVFLSGGVDSGAVANLAQRASPDRRIETFTLAFEDTELNEGDDARAIAAAIGSKHREILLTEGGLRRRPRHRDRHPRPADLRRAELVLHGQGGTRGRSHRCAGRDRRGRAVRWLRDVSAACPRYRPGPRRARRAPASRRAAAQAVRIATQRGRRGVGSAADAVGEASRHGRGRRRPHRSVPAELCAVPPRAPGGAARRGASAATGSRRPCTSAWLGEVERAFHPRCHQRPRAALLPRRAAAARQRRREHGGVARAADCRSSIRC